MWVDIDSTRATRRTGDHSEGSLDCRHRQRDASLLVWSERGKSPFARQVRVEYHFFGLAGLGAPFSGQNNRIDSRRTREPGRQSIHQASVRSQTLLLIHFYFHFPFVKSSESFGECPASSSTRLLKSYSSPRSPSSSFNLQVLLQIFIIPFEEINTYSPINTQAIRCPQSSSCATQLILILQSKPPCSPTLSSYTRRPWL